VSLASQLTLLATRVATEFKTVRTEIAAVSGGTSVKASALPKVTGQTVALLDTAVTRDISNTAQDATNGSLSEATWLEVFGSTRKSLTNHNTATVISAAGATDTYLTGSNIALPSGYPVVGTRYLLQFLVSKTAAGTATPVVTIRIGTAGTTADTARLTFTFGAGTAIADVALVEVIVDFRTVGSGTTAVAQGVARATTNLTTTGWSNAVKALTVVSSGFDSTVANLIIGASYNGGTGAVHTVPTVLSELRV
jgi:hypothetical protein